MGKRQERNKELHAQTDSSETLHSLQTAVETMQLGVTITDLAGVIVYTNKAEAVMHGYTVDELIGKRVSIFAPRDLHNPMTLQRIQEMHRWHRESLNVRKDGTTFPVHLRSDVVTNHAGQPIGVITTCEDITQQRKANDQLDLSLSLLRATLESTADGILVVNKAGEIVIHNRKFQEMWNIQNDALANGKSVEILELVLARLKERESFMKRVQRVQEQPDEQSFSLMELQDGKYYESYSQPQRINGKSVGRVWCFRDITERKKAEERLQHDAFHDALTGLPNRALFLDRLSVIVAKRRRYYLFAVLFLDLDRFKVINDSLGHMAGDQLLEDVARRLESCLRPGDTVARFGGDEFAILLDDIKDVSDSIRIAERIQTDFAAPFRLEEQDVFTSVSIGIALGATGFDSPDDLLRDADTAMYRAKLQGKARHEVFDKEMHSRAVALLKLETDLRRAVERQEFSIAYQPIVALQTGKIIGFEALLRWQHPERGLVYPAEFIAMAEETGLIVPISRWVMQQACSQLCAWQKHPQCAGLTISINLSGKHFMQRDLLNHITQTLKETALDPALLKLEITESVLMQNADAAATTMFKLKALNVEIHIDDFGTGYSSFSYLHRFPFDTLKIDRSFVSRMAVNEESLEIVRTMMMLARNLGKEVIAEGIETTRQLALLRELECNNGQGFHFSQPVDHSKAEALILNQPQW